MRNTIGLAMLAAVLAGCGSGASGGGSGLTGTLAIDGSSTVYPISQAVAEEFMAENPDVSVTVNESGTGGGMKKFSKGEIDICDASRPIDDEEIAECAKNGVEFIEIPIAFDGLSIVVNPGNTFANDLTVAELKAIWEPESKVDNWSQVRPGFPNVPIKLFGPGTDSGTFEYFTEAIVQQKKASRTDYAASEDDNVLVQGVGGEKGGLGYFGFSYFVANSDKVKVVPVDSGNGPVSPSVTSIADGTYYPLSRPLFLYVNTKLLDTELGKRFLDYYLGANGRVLIAESGYVALPAAAYDKITTRVSERKTGSVFATTNWVGMKIEDILARE